MDGVTILNTYISLTTLDAVHLLIWGFILIGLAIYSMINVIDDKNSRISIFLAITCICVFALILYYCPKTKHIQATVDQSVSWAELTERYEVIRVDGRIVTMIEKNEE